MSAKCLPSAFLITLVIAAASLAGQQSAPATPATERTELLIESRGHDPVHLAIGELKTLPHLTVTIHNSHTNADETYSGVRVADLLTKVGAPLGNELRGKALANYIVATGSDGYQSVIALGEIDPAFHPGEVLVADSVNGKPLDEHNGPFKLVVTEDKRPARSVRNLTTLELKSVQ
jgi:hypothetical protein